VFCPHESKFGKLKNVNDKSFDKTQIDVLRFCREEIRHEFALLSVRMTWYVTCQSFLITAFAIFTANNFLKSFPWFNLCIAVLGIVTSYLTLSPIKATHETIAMWLEKQRAVFSIPQLQEDHSKIHYSIPRNFLTISADARHQKSLIFSRYNPWIFIFV
jgi:hypothetical protein